MLTALNTLPIGFSEGRSIKETWNDFFFVVLQMLSGSMNTKSNATFSLRFHCHVSFLSLWMDTLIFFSEIRWFIQFICTSCNEWDSFDCMCQQPTQFLWFNELVSAGIIELNWIAPAKVQLSAIIPSKGHIVHLWRSTESIMIWPSSLTSSIYH